MGIADRRDEDIESSPGRVGGDGGDGEEKRQEVKANKVDRRTVELAGLVESISHGERPRSGPWNSAATGMIVAGAATTETETDIAR